MSISSGTAVLLLCRSAAQVGCESEFGLVTSYTSAALTYSSRPLAMGDQLKVTSLLSVESKMAISVTRSFCMLHMAIKGGGWVHLMTCISAVK